MKEKLSYTYEEALEEEKELVGKPELMAVVKDYAAVHSIRLTIAVY